MGAMFYVMPRLRRVASNRPSSRSNAPPVGPATGSAKLTKWSKRRSSHWPSRRQVEQQGNLAGKSSFVRLETELKCAVFRAEVGSTNLSPSSRSPDRRQLAQAGHSSRHQNGRKVNSSCVFCFPRLKRMLARALVRMQIHSCQHVRRLGRTRTNMQPPVESASPFRSSAMISASPSMLSK